jgi:hypothetical protein
VPGPAGGDQGLPDQPRGVGAAREQSGIEHDGVTPQLAHSARSGRAAQVADRALAGEPPRPQRLAAAQRDAGRRGVEDLDHRPSRQDRPGRLSS